MTFTERVIQVIQQIPPGRVVTYGQVAFMAGNHRAARQVVRVLHSSSQKHNLPWHRVINREGKISLKPGEGFEEQQHLLQSEGIVFDHQQRINLDHYLWNPA